MRKAIVLIAGLLILVGVTVAISSKEQLLVSGRVVFLELAPVDPRSLMQGDYMALRFKITNEVFGTRLDQRSMPSDGRVVLTVEENDVAKFKRLDDASPLAADEVAMQYRIRENKPKFATNAFFFQEGHAMDYAKARYGEFRVAGNGECILTGLRDENLAQLGMLSAHQ